MDIERGDIEEGGRLTSDIEDLDKEIKVYETMASEYSPTDDLLF